MLRLRYPIAGILAAVVTVLLFFQMQALIAMRTGSRQPAEETNVIEFVHLKRRPELQLKDRELPKKEAPDKLPPLPELDLEVSRTMRPRDTTIEGLVPVVDLSLDMAGGPGLGAAPSDTDIVPLVRVNPQYPFQAMERGIEGWVEIEFTISTTGTVKDPVVLDSRPETIFDRAALRAIRKWRYKPKVKDGIAVERGGVRVRLKFEIED